LQSNEYMIVLFDIVNLEKFHVTKKWG